MVTTSYALCDARAIYASQANAADGNVRALNAAIEQTCMHGYEYMCLVWIQLWAGGQFRGLLAQG